MNINTLWGILLFYGIANSLMMVWLLFRLYRAEEKIEAIEEYLG